MAIHRSKSLAEAPHSRHSLTELIASLNVTTVPAKIEVHALPEMNYLVNWMYFEGDFTVSLVTVLSYTQRLQKWSISYVMKESKLQLDYRKLGHVKPVLGEENMPWNLYPREEGVEGDRCMDIIFWMEDDLREFVLCPERFIPDPSFPNIVKIRYIPYGACFQYLPPWYDDPHDDRHVFSIVRQDNSGLLAMVDEGDQISLFYMGTLKNCPAVKNGTGDFDRCVPCVMQCMGSAGSPTLLQDGPEAPELLVPDSGTGRLMIYSCENATLLRSEVYPSWLSTPMTEVTNCVFTIFEVSDINTATPVIPSAPVHAAPSPHDAPTSQSPPHGHFRSKSTNQAKWRSSSSAKKAEKESRNFFSDSAPSPTAPLHTKTCMNLPSIPWITELVVNEPLTLTLAANRTVRFSYNADLVYATHFTRDGISSVSVIDVSNGGVFEQGSLPLDSDDVAGSVVNSFSDDIDRDNQFLYVVGYYFNYTTDQSTPALFRYDVSPKGQPSLLSQIYIESRSGVTATSNYMVPLPQVPGITVVATPREVIIKEVSASSLALRGRYITSQYTSSEVLDINVVRPVLSPDGSTLLVFVQTRGLGHMDNIISAYVMDINVAFKNNSKNSVQTPSNAVHLDEINAKNVEASLRSAFGRNVKVEMDEFNRQYETLKSTTRSGARTESTSTRSHSSYASQSRAIPAKAPVAPPAPGTFIPPFVGHPPPISAPIDSTSPIFTAPQNPDIDPDEQWFNQTYTVSINVRCRFWISNNSRLHEQPIGASFVEGTNNAIIILAVTSIEVGFEDTQIHVYDLTQCRGANLNNSQAIHYSNLTRLTPLATARPQIVWDSLPFADDIYNSNLQTGDSPGVRFWDIPTFRLDDGAVVFWLSNQSLNVGIGHTMSHRHQIPHDDYSSTLVQFVWNATGIHLRAVSEPIDCSPITSQVVQLPTPEPPAVPVNQTNVWVLCQWTKDATDDDETVRYNIISWHISSPTFPDLPTTPFEAEPEFESFKKKKEWERKTKMKNGRRANRSGEIVMRAVIGSEDARYTSDDVPAQSPDPNGPYIVDDAAIWFVDVGVNLSVVNEDWPKAEVLNFFVQWEDHRVYFGNAESYHIVAITKDDRAFVFGEALFTSAKLVNSLVAWSQFSGFGFLGDVQWIWVISECSAGTNMATTGYCSKCRPGTFGLGCGLCTAGYMCDGFGLLVPSSLCIEGSYCEAGTTRTQDRNPPKICPPGTYCPGGVAALEGPNSARPCGPGYYCPANTSVANPQNYKCPPNSQSDVGASSIDDCLCYETHIGSSGKCRKLPMNARRIMWGKEAVMTYDVGYFPAGNGTHEGVQYLERCDLNPIVCNGHPNPNASRISNAPNVPRTVCKYVCNSHHEDPHGPTSPGSHDPDPHATPHHKKALKRNGGGGSGEHHSPECIIKCDWATECKKPTKGDACGWEAICDDGYEARMCSRCSKGYYERGHTCSPCSEQVEHRKIRTYIFLGIGVMLILLLLLLVVIGQAFIALILELLSMVALNMIGLVPVWLLDILLIFIMVYFINRGKRYNTLIKLQEERAVKRRLRRRAKRMSMKKRMRATMSRATSRATSRYTSGRTIGATSNDARISRRTVQLVAPTDEEIRQTLGLPVDAPIDHSDPEVREAEKAIIEERKTLSFEVDGDQDGAISATEGFMALTSEDEDDTLTVDEEDYSSEELDDLKHIEGFDDDSDGEDGDEDDETEDSEFDENTMDSMEEEALLARRGNAVLPDDDDARGTLGAHSSSKKYAGKVIAPVSHKGLSLALRPAPNRALLPQSHYDRAFELATGHTPQEALDISKYGHGPKHASHGAEDHKEHDSHDHGGHKEADGGHGGHGGGHGGHGEDEEAHHEHEYISEGLIKSFLFYLQTTEALTEGLWKWMNLLLNLQEISPFSRVAIFDCTAPVLFTYQARFIMYLVLLPLLTLCMFLMYLLGVAKTTWDLRKKKMTMAKDAESQARVGFLRMAWAHEDENTPIRTGVTKADLQKLESKRRRLRYRWARIWLFFVSVFYFELTEGILKVFRCEKDEATELSYMESQPWVVCDVRDPTSPYRIVFPLAIVGLIVYTIGIPILFFYLLFRHRHRLHNPKVMSWLGMLYEEYQPHLWWFEMTMIARRVLIALLISTVPSESSWGSIGVMAVLMAAMATNIWFRAFVSDAENTVDLMAMCVLMITYIGGVMQKERKLFHDLEGLRRNIDASSGDETSSEPAMHAPNASDSNALVASWKNLDALEIFIFVLNLCMFLIYLGVLLRPRIISMYHWCVNRYRAWKQKRRDERHAQMVARNANFHHLQTDDEAPQGYLVYGDGNDDKRPLLHRPEY